MTRQLDSGALTLLNEMLQLGGGGEQTTTLDDGNVSQVLSIDKIVRRSLTFASTAGLFYFGFTNTHVGAGAIATVINPYESDAGANAFPTTTPRGFDLWLLYIIMRRTSGAGALTGGVFEIQMALTMRGKGNIITAPQIGVGIWDGIEALTARSYAVTQDGETMLRPNLRLRRGVTLIARTNAAAAATFQTAAIVGAFPAGLDQDAVT